MSLLGHKEFTPALIKAFTEVREEVEDEVFSGLLHLEMACFARYTQAAIDAGDYERLSECYEFADRFFRAADDELKNAFGSVAKIAFQVVSLPQALLIFFTRSGHEA
jgi:hypothetical protein